MRFAHPSERNFGFRFDDLAGGQIEPRCYCFSSSSSDSAQSTSSVSGASATGAQAATAGDLATVQTGGVRNEGSGTTTAQSVRLSGTNTGTVTVHAGASDDVLRNLVSTLTSASNREVAQLAESGNNTASLLGALLSQKTDVGAGNPKTLAYVAVAALVAILGFAFLIFKKR